MQLVDVCALEDIAPGLSVPTFPVEIVAGRVRIGIGNATR